MDPILAALLLMTGLPLLRGVIGWARRCPRVVFGGLAMCAAVHAFAGDAARESAARPIAALADAAEAVSWASVQAHIATAGALPTTDMGGWSDEDLVTYYEVENRRYVGQIQRSVLRFLEDLPG